MIAVATAAVLSFAYIGVFRYWTPIDCEEFLPFKHRRDRVLKRFRDGRRVYAQTGTDMNFRRSLPEIRCAMIYWTTTIPHHNGPPPDPFQEMHAGCGSCELLGDVHQVHVRPICTSLLALGPILFTQAKSMGRRSPRLRVDRRRTIFRVASTDRNQISGLSTSHKGTSGERSLMPPCQDDRAASI